MLGKIIQGRWKAPERLNIFIISYARRLKLAKLIGELKYVYWALLQTPNLWWTTDHEESVDLGILKYVSIG